MFSLEIEIFAYTISGILFPPGIETFPKIAHLGTDLHRFMMEVSLCVQNEFPEPSENCYQNACNIIVFVLQCI